MKQPKYKENDGKEMKGSSSPSSSFSSPSGRGLRKLALLPTLIALAVVASHSRCHVVDASIEEENKKKETDGELIVLDDHDTSIVEFGSGNTRPRRYVVEEDDEEAEEDDYVDGEHTSNHDDNNSSEKNIDNLIVVVSVDGTLAGIDKNTGKVLWKQSREGMETQQQQQQRSSHQHMKPNKSKPDSPQIRLLQPLISTTTTTKSASKSEYAAVPSVDGNVYMTSNDVTVTTSIKDLVSRAPFLDSKGRFYVGSRHATAAALDGDTGEILRIVSAADVPAQENDIISLEGRNTLWVGRIDYSVTVQDARTGIVDAQFSVADMMSVSDMQGSRGIAAWNADKQQSDTKQQSTTTSNSAFTSRLRQLPAPNEESSTLAASDGGPSALVATPSGNLAYRDSDTGELQWVADTSFDSPIAYAMDATSGVSLGVDIIPDVPIPDSNIEYLSREIGRQLELIREQQLEKHDQTIVGAMANGQLYALPLGGRPQLAATTPLQAQQHAAVAANTAMHIPKVPQITGGRTNLHPQTTSDGKQAVATRRHCDPLSSQFPGCLIGKQNQHQRVDYHPLVPHGSHLSGSELDPSVGDGENEFNDQDGLAVGTVGQYPEGGFYHPDLGFVSAQDLQRIQQRMQPPSRKRTLMKIMSSWLPPTIALIFVLSFELGRRKRLKDNQKAADNLNHQPLITDESSVQKIDDRDSNQLQITQKQQQQQQHVIQVSDEVLGYGGQGTVVYRGMLDGRSVAVKRMLSAYHASADREISLLIESDGHPNVVRYFLKEVRGDFVYLALELCSLSLHDLIGTIRQTEEGTPCDKTKTHPEIYESSKSILLQIASGVKHLHALRIVHRDLKPANILLAVSKRKNTTKKTADDEESVIDTFLKGSYIAKISDMGLGKQLVGQSSLGASWIAESSLRGGSKAGTGSVGVGPGSVGWQAPEVMAARWTSSDASARSGDSSGGVPPVTLMIDASTHQRTSRSVDIFSLGCIFHSTLIPGNHPFGEWYEREANIMHNRPKLDSLKALSPDAHDLVSGMLNRNPKLRPTAKEICEHPFFWTAQKKVQFLCEFSDRLETDACAGDAALVTNALVIERGAAEVVGTTWDQHLDDALISNVQKFRSYDTTSVRDLLRLIRNKYHHFDELPAEFRATNACDQNAFLTYFESRFPRLLMHCFNCCRHLLAEDDGFAAKYNIVRPPTIEVVSTPVAEVPIQREIFQNADINQVEGTADTTVEVVGASTTSSQMGDEEKTASFETEFVRVSRENSSRLSDDPIDVDLAGIELDDTKESNDGGTSPEPELVESVHAPNNILNVADNIIAWEGSTVAKTLNCRGWSRSEDDWSTRIDPFYRKCEQNLKRNLEDPRFRTRLCNHWDESLGTFCPMRKKNKCVFGHGPVELRVKEPKKNRWGKLVDKNGNNSNPCHSGGEDTYGAARSIESARKTEGKWNTPQKRGTKGKKQASNNRKKKNDD